MAIPLSTPQALERSVIRKVLARLAPFLAFLYVFNLLDRTNVSIAASTMQKDLNLSNTVYSLGAGIFFIGYFIFEIPSNLIMEKVGARRWIARIMISWGVVSACMMFVKTPGSFYFLRFMLGVAEAGFYPGIVLYFTYWVPANARAQVISRFLSLTALIGIFGPFLGGLLLQLDGTYGLKGWQWLFLLEGIPSVLLGFVVWGVLPNGPEGAKWLSQDEKNWLTKRLETEANNDQRVHHLSFKVALSDPRIRQLCLIFIVTSTAINAVGFYGPKIILAWSHETWSPASAAKILIIPGIVGAIGMMIGAAHSDRTGRRRAHVTIGYFVAGLGFLALVFAPNPWWIAAALSLNVLGERIAAGSYWALTTNLMGAKAAAGGIAFINSVGNLGGFIGPLMMVKVKDYTHGQYTPGIYVAAGLMFLGAFFCYRLHAQPTTEASPQADMAAEPAH